MGCETCARRLYCPFYKLVKQPCPYYVPDYQKAVIKDYWYGRPLTTDGGVVE